MKLSERSQQILATCHPDLQRLIQEVALQFPLVVLQGERTPEEQARLVTKGYSRTLDSKHLGRPARAVDIAPDPVDWNDLPRFYFLAGYVRGIAAKLEIPCRFGADWDGDTNVAEEKLKDPGHIELA